MYIGYLRLECDIDTDGVRTEQREGRASVAADLGVGLERQMIEREQILGCIVNAHPSQSDRVQEMFG